MIGPWLSGAYDSDKSVARAAQESISASFTTDDRIKALWKLYRDALVEYAEDAILVQTSKTLSDERSTSADDAEAKFVRVVCNAVLMLSQVVKINHSKTPTTSLPGVSDGVRRIVSDKRLWEYSSYNDPSLRRAVCGFVIVCTDTISADLDWKTISSCFVGKALQASQLGSSRQLSEALVALTTARPEIWTTDYTSKTAASKRLFQYLRNGSQRGSADFWTNTAHLLRRIPPQAWSVDSVDQKIALHAATTLVEAWQIGVTNSEEPRQNLEAAWSTYVDVSFWTLDLLRDNESRETLLNQHLLPLLNQYTAGDPNPQQASWTVTSPSNPRISASILVGILHREMSASFESAWYNICQRMANDMKLSLPESSNDFTKSQEGVIAHAQRLLRLKPLVLGADVLTSSQKKYAEQVFRKSDDRMMNDAVDLLKARNGKPYSAASVLETIAMTGKPSDTPALESFLSSEALTLLASPSAEYLISIMVHNRQYLLQAISVLIKSGGGAFSAKALLQLLGQISVVDLSQNADLEPFVLSRISSDLGKDSVQQMTKAIVQNPNLKSSGFRNGCWDKIFDRLSSDKDSNSHHTTLRFLISLFSDSSSAAVVLSDDFGSRLLSKLLVLSDSEDAETAELSNSLVSKIKAMPTSRESAIASSVNIIVDQLSGVGTPLSIFTLIDLSKDTLESASSDKDKVVESLVPSASQWNAALESHIHARRPMSLSITNTLQGLIFMVQQENTPAPITPTPDSDEFSLLFRLVLYMTRMLIDTDLRSHQSISSLQTLYHHYPLALQLVNEKLTVESANKIWRNTTHEVTEEAAEVLSQGNSLVQSWSQDESMVKLWIDTLRSTHDLTPRSYFQGLTFTDISSRFIDGHGPTLIMLAFEAEIKDIYQSTEVVRSTSLICTCRDYIVSSQQGRRLLNELISACTELKTSPTSTIGLRPLVLLNIFLSGSSEPLQGVPTQRLVFLMQALLRILANGSSCLAYLTEAMKLLEPVLSATREVFGDHWEQTFQILAGLWRNENDLNEDLPLLHASLRLYGRLRALASSEDANEDLSDSWNVTQPSLEAGLLNCLESFMHPSTGMNQPRLITADLLRRQLSHISIRYDVFLYSLLSSSETAIRGAAYDLLHRSIPGEQEKISLDLALEKKIVHLAPALLSLLSEAPQAKSPEVAPTRQSYLLRWHLVFDHFPKSSYKLRETYAADIKEKDVLGQLLDLIVDVCRITSSRPSDASKTDITNFKIGSAETDEQEELWLAMHLYYCCLLFLPGLTRSWFIEQKNRVKSPLESWTQRYFAPTLMSAATATVTEWVESQSQDESDAQIMVKTSLSGSEAVASIAVDPESPPISLAISLPKSYPLESPTVSSRSRVGVSEKNWLSWLRTFQIIIFSTGSIIEGLVAFRRNVQGALKGQNECAICYSIIGTDMQTPNKRCGTCRNTFHGVCLFRWFRSSNSSSCPLCRNNFNYA